MIGIKGMELPKSCSSCEITEYYCHICPIIGESKLDYKDNRNPNCPLVDLGKEDMSWDELFKNLEQLKNVETVYKRIDEIVVRANFTQREYLLTKTGKIFKIFDLQKHGIIMKLDLFEDIGYSKMYQIIKSLVGDER